VLNSWKFWLHNKECLYVVPFRQIIREKSIAQNKVPSSERYFCYVWNTIFLLPHSMHLFYKTHTLFNIQALPSTRFGTLRANYKKYSFLGLLNVVVIKLKINTPLIIAHVESKSAKTQIHLESKANSAKLRFLFVLLLVKSCN
jgi:hypothetical protein